MLHDCNEYIIVIENFLTEKSKDPNQRQRRNLFRQISLQPSGKQYTNEGDDGQTTNDTGSTQNHSSEHQKKPMRK